MPSARPQGKNGDELIPEALQALVPALELSFLQAELSGSLLQDLPVYIGVTQPPCDLLTDVRSAAAQFTGNRDDNRRWHLALPLIKGDQAEDRIRSEYSIWKKEGSIVPLSPKTKFNSFKHFLTDLSTNEDSFVSHTNLPARAPARVRKGAKIPALRPGPVSPAPPLHGNGGLFPPGDGCSPP